MLNRNTINSLISDLEFEKYYLEVLVGRFTSGSIQLETDNDSADYNSALMYSNNLTALKYLLHEESMLRIDIIQNVGKILEEDSNDKGFRNVDIYVGGSNVERAHPKDIYMKMYSLLDNYYNVWNFCGNIFLREAMFHLQFLMIHPFSDGNGRTARVITTTNLLKQGILPGVITKKDKKEYCEIIESQNANRLATFFEKLSFKEDVIFAELYEKYNRVDKNIIKKADNIEERKLL